MLLPDPDATMLQIDSILASLPSSVCRIALNFRFGAPSFYVEELDSDWEARFWEVVDDAVARPTLPKVERVQLQWGHSVSGRSKIKKSLSELYRSGAFERVLPKIYRRGILWCGDFNSAEVYPMTGNCEDWSAWDSFFRRDRIA